MSSLNFNCEILVDDEINMSLIFLLYIIVSYVACLFLYCFRTLDTSLEFTSLASLAYLYSSCDLYVTGITSCLRSTCVVSVWTCKLGVDRSNKFTNISITIVYIRHVCSLILTLNVIFFQITYCTSNSNNNWSARIPFQVCIKCNVPVLKCLIDHTIRAGVITIKVRTKTRGIIFCIAISIRYKYLWSHILYWTLCHTTAWRDTVLQALSHKATECERLYYNAGSFHISGFGGFFCVLVLLSLSIWMCKRPNSVGSSSDWHEFSNQNQAA